MRLDYAMRRDYLEKFLSLGTAAESDQAGKNMAQRILANQSRYEAVVAKCAEIEIPITWPVVGVIHAMECGLRFDCYLHNGDPLWDEKRTLIPTVKVPKGRGPFASWEEAAADAISMMFDKRVILDTDRHGAPGFDYFNPLDFAGNFVTSPRIDEVLYFLEKYNGFGYRDYHDKMPTPYLWSRTPFYKKGKYDKDGHFNAEMVSDQIGAALLLYLIDKLSPGYHFTLSEPPLFDVSDNASVTSLQMFLNMVSTKCFLFPELKRDGNYGPKTQARFIQVFGLGKGKQI